MSILETLNEIESFLKTHAKKFPKEPMEITKSLTLIFNLKKYINEFKKPK